MHPEPFCYFYDLFLGGEALHPPSPGFLWSSDYRIPLAEGPSHLVVHAAQLTLACALSPAIKLRLPSQSVKV